MAARVSRARAARNRVELGIMVSSRDFWELSTALPDFTELLLFEGDDLGVVRRIQHEGWSKEVLPLVRFVHAQEFILYKCRKRLLDLSSGDEDFRGASVGAVLMAREVANGLGGLPVVIHPGGIRRDVRSRDSLLDNLEQSLKELGSAGLLLENMPWFYWYRKKDRMLSNACVSIEDIRRFSRFVDGLTLDVCHGYLSKPEGDQGYCRRFMKTFGSKIKHIHVSDARAPDCEGLQIGEGEVDFSFLKGAEVPITVEIWNGHLDDGKGFWRGIERLRALERSW